MTNSGNGKRVKCNVEFKSQETKTISGITFKLNTFSPDFKKSACSSCESTESGVFAAEDDYGTSYYYRGSVDNNYVDFAGKTWRIVRINGDGSVRIILDGTTGEETFFNNSVTDNAYVGYMYGTTGSSNYDATHKNTNDSVLKKYIDTWYENNLKNYSNYLADSGFCGDRSVLEADGTAGIQEVSTHYGAYLRITASTPSLKCTQSNDLFTTISANMGNKALKYPIATITADEVMLAGSGGGIFDGWCNYVAASYNYLYSSNNETYWTMTPSGGYVSYGFDGFTSTVFGMNYNNSYDDKFTNASWGIRPVVNLKSDAIKSGSGTVSDPYKVA